MDAVRIESFHIVCAMLAKQRTRLSPAVDVQIVRFPGGDTPNFGPSEVRDGKIRVPVTLRCVVRRRFPTQLLRRSVYPTDPA